MQRWNIKKCYVSTYIHVLQKHTLPTSLLWLAPCTDTFRKCDLYLIFLTKGQDMCWYCHVSVSIIYNIISMNCFKEWKLSVSLDASATSEGKLFLFFLRIPKWWTRKLGKNTKTMLFNSLNSVSCVCFCLWNYLWLNNLLGQWCSVSPKTRGVALAFKVLGE